MGSGQTEFLDNTNELPKIENYYLVDFNKNKEEAILVNKTNILDRVTISFIKDSKSDNGYSLEDKDGLKFDFVSK